MINYQIPFWVKCQIERNDLNHNAQRCNRLKSGQLTELPNKQTL